MLVRAINILKGQEDSVDKLQKAIDATGLNEGSKIVVSDDVELVPAGFLTVYDSSGDIYISDREVASVLDEIAEEVATYQELWSALALFEMGESAVLDQITPSIEDMFTIKDLKDDHEYYVADDADMGDPGFATGKELKEVIQMFMGSDEATEDTEFNLIDITAGDPIVRKMIENNW